MASTIPVLEGQFGSTTYYMTTMKASEVINRVHVPKNLDGWALMSIEERWQREINYNRVKNQIAPYLVNTKDRFFGSLVVAIYKGNKPKFEPLKKMSPNILGGAYSEPIERLGFLTLAGNEILVPLDGQHRLAALKFAITGKDEKDKEIPDEVFVSKKDLANEDVSIILVEFDKKRSRRIFNNLNRYAKKTTKAINLVTDDDDVFAVISRENIAGEYINPRLINYKNTTLPDSKPEFITLTTIYDAVVNICLTLNDIDGKFDISKLPDPATRNLFVSSAQDLFESLMDKVEIFKIATEDMEESGDQTRVDLRTGPDGSLLMKPLGQLCLIDAFVSVKKSKQPNGGTLTNNQICERINKIDWIKSNPMWQNVLMDGEKIRSGKSTRSFASRYIAYMIGENLNSAEKNDLLDLYKQQYPPRNRDSVKLPRKID